MTSPVVYVGCPREDYCLASIPVLPGCIASGKTRDEAVANARRAFRAYLELLQARGVSVDHWRSIDPDALPVKDTPATGLLPEDEGGLEEHEIRDFLHIFETQQAALIALVQQLSPDEMQRQPEDTWSVREVLEHMMTTQAGLLSRMEQWPDDPFNTLQAIHRLVFQRFTVMDPQDTRKTTTIRGRPWTVRRVMRRILEHEWEHYQHVQEVMGKLASKR